MVSPVARVDRLARRYHDEARAGGASLGQILGEVLAARERTLALLDGADEGTRGRAEALFDHAVATLGAEYAGSATAPRPPPSP